MLSVLQNGIVVDMKQKDTNFDTFAVAYVQQLAKERDLTQTKLAELSGIEQYRISRAFSGGKPFSFKEMRALASAFNMTFSRFAGDIDNAYTEEVIAATTYASTVDAKIRALSQDNYAMAARAPFPDPHATVGEESQAPGESDE